MRHREGKASCAKSAINKGKCRCVAAAGAVDATDLVAADRKLIDMRVASLGPPSTSVIIGILRPCHRSHAEHGQHCYQLLHFASLSAKGASIARSPVVVSLQALASIGADLRCRVFGTFLLQPVQTFVVIQDHCCKCQEGRHSFARNTWSES